MLANAAAIERLARRLGVDLVHARSRAPAWSALMAARRARVPFVTTYHGAYGETNALKRTYNSVMARGDVVIANSRYTADQIAQRYGTLAATPGGDPPRCRLPPVRPSGNCPGAGIGAAQRAGASIRQPDHPARGQADGLERPERADRRRGTPEGHRTTR